MSRSSEEQHPVEINTELRKKKVTNNNNPSAQLLGETIVTSVWKVYQPSENTNNWHI